MNYDDVKNPLYRTMFTEAMEAANVAGDQWLANAKPSVEFYNEDLEGNRLSESTVMLDQMGGAYIKVKDRRTSIFKQLKRNDLIRGEDHLVVKHKFVGRTELGLRVACVEAFKKVLESYGIDNLKTGSYLD